MSINSKLESLYRRYWDELQTEGVKLLGQKKSPASPLVLQVDEESYSQSDLKVMIFGQETWGWGKFEDSLQVCLDRYERFFLKENFYKGYSKSSFWKAFRDFKKSFVDENKGKKISFMWNNISKIGTDNEKGVTEDIRTLEREKFPVIESRVFRILCQAHRLRCFSSRSGKWIASWASVKFQFWIGCVQRSDALSMPA